MWFGLAFVTLGFLAGQLVGLSATSLGTSLLGLLFAFGGGSAIAVLKKLEGADRPLAFKAIFLLSIGCLVGIYAGIYVSEHQLLTPDRMVAAARISAGDEKYLRRNVTEAALNIDTRKANRELTAGQAVDELVGIADRASQEAADVRRRQQRGNISDQKAYDELFAYLSGK